MARASSRLAVSSARVSVAWPSLSLSVAALLMACHAAPVNPWMAVPSARFDGRAFGDTVGMRTSIVAMDTVRDVAVFALSAPAHLVVLDVRPGVSIEQLQPGIGAKTLLRRAGEHMVATVDATTQRDEAARLAQKAYDECVDHAEMVARRRPANKPMVVRDSSGKVTAASAEAQRRYDEQGSRASDADMAACAHARAPNPRFAARKPARVGEHYLVLLASQSALSGAEVAERLRTLSVVGSDVATTIEAIAAGLFVGHAGSWSGYYISR